MHLAIGCMYDDSGLDSSSKIINEHSNYTTKLIVVNVRYFPELTTQLFCTDIENLVILIKSRNYTIIIVK